MDQRTKSIIFGAVGLVVLIAILGSVVYLGRFAKNLTDTSNNNTDNNPLSQLPVSSATPSGTINPTPRQAATLKAYVGQGFNILYPASWGILTCSNSRNIEFDPTNPVDQKNIACEVALKPITVLVDETTGCQGETVNIGNNRVVRSKNVKPDNGGIDYRWCLTVGGKNLDITHRVSPAATRATSKDDFSIQVEQMIKNTNASPAGS